MDLAICPHCNIRVFPMNDGNCPSCRQRAWEPRESVIESSLQEPELALEESGVSVPETATKDESIVMIDGNTVSQIRAIARRGAAQNATKSLAAWGAINLGAWILLGAENREFLQNLSGDPSGGMLLLIYCPLALGIGMLAFAALGAATQSVFTVFLDGISLLGVGLWNLCSDFIAISVLQPYGYTVQGISPFWIMIGVCQIVWGCREFSICSRMSAWNIPQFTADELDPIREKLTSLVLLDEDPKRGVIKGSITVKGPLGLDFFTKTTQYTGTLSGNEILMVSAELDDCFRIKREFENSVTFGSGALAEVYDDYVRKALLLSPLSAITIREWLGLAIRPTDIRAAAVGKSLTLEMLEPWLSSEDAEVRAAAVTALTSVTDEEATTVAARFTDDSAALVVIAALETATQLKSLDMEQRTRSLLTNTDECVRASAAKYFTAHPQLSIRNDLVRALATETSPPVKRQLKHAIRSLDKVH